MELAQTPNHNLSHDIHRDISYIWTRFNRRWLACGAGAGLGAGLLMIVVAAILTRDPLLPPRLVGAALLGPEALRTGTVLGAALGGVIHFGLCAFFGLAFAQFVWEHSRKRVLFLLGTLAGLAVWLFWSMMFMPAFNEPLFYALPKSASLLLHLLFGVMFGALIVTLRARLCEKLDQ